MTEMLLFFLRHFCHVLQSAICYIMVFALFLLHSTCAPSEIIVGP